MKHLYIIFVFLFTVLFSFSILGQEVGSFRGDFKIPTPQKIFKPVADPLPAGTYTVGVGGDFQTITSAFEKLSIDGIAGEVILELISNLYAAPNDSFGYKLIGPIPGAGENSRVTIKPALNKNVTIVGRGWFAMSFWNTSYVTIDGVDIEGPTTLTIHSLQNTQYPWNEGIDFLDNSDHNIIQNTIFIDEDYTRSGGGIGIFSMNDTQSAPDSNLIQNNFIKKSGIGIYVSAYNTGAFTIANGNIIRENIIGSESDTLISWGIQVEKNYQSIIENNLVQGMRAYSTTLEGAHGINTYWGISCITRNNIVHNVLSYESTNSTGILLSGSAAQSGSINMVHNNMIYDIQCLSTQINSRVAGIQMWRQNSPKIYYNTVYLTGEGSNYFGSVCLSIESVTDNVDIKNNVFVNMRNESPYCASTVLNYFSSNFTSDYNDMYYDDTNPDNCLLRIGSVDYHTLGEWQASGKDIHSLSVSPCFCSPSLHIDCTIATCLESRGTPIAGLDADIDGDLRHAYLPDIGADEFIGLRPTGALPTGAYSVGKHGYFSSVEAIFNRLETDGMAGPVTLELTDDFIFAPSDSFGFKIDGPISGADADNRLIIKPAQNKNVMVVGNGRMTFSFWNTSYVTIDGVDITGETTLTIHTIQNTRYPWNEGIDFLDNSDHNVIQNTIFINEDYNRAGGGIGIFSLTSTQTAPDSNIIQNNLIKRSGIGIYLSAYNTGAFTIATGNIIRGNIIGSETDTLISWGMQVEKTYKTIIENNFVEGIRRHSTVFDGTAGINSYWGLENIIRNNIVRNVNSYDGTGSTGILLSGAAANSGSLNMVYNNMIYDIQSLSSNVESRICGIQMWNQNSPKIYYNSIYLTGTGANHFGSYCLRIENPSDNVNVKNNVFVNMRDESPYCASTIFDYFSSNITTDYNDFYFDDSNPNNCLVKIGGLNYQTLAEWQAEGKDLHSYPEMPHFIDPYLHIDEDTETYLESRGTPIAEVLYDFDGDSRGVDSTDIGADEFNGIFKVTGVEDEETIPTEFALEQNYPNPFNPSTRIKYSVPSTSQIQIKVFDVLGNEIETLVNEEKSIGNYELIWNAVNLPSGVYFYQLRAGDFVSTKKMILIK